MAEAVIVAGKVLMLAAASFCALAVFLSPRLIRKLATNTDEFLLPLRWRIASWIVFPAALAGFSVFCWYGWGPILDELSSRRISVAAVEFWWWVRAVLTAASVIWIIAVIDSIAWKSAGRRDTR